MSLPFLSPLLPMLAKRVEAVPHEPGWIFEPKWDGFRAVVFRDREMVTIQSRDGKTLNRYFPELIEPLKAGLPERCVLDGEVVIAGAAGLDFDALQLRIHPAASRVRMLAEQQPASVVFFDCLAEGEEDLRERPFGERRQRLERMLRGCAAPLHVTPATGDADVAEDWFQRFEGAGLDGVMAKRADGRYEPDKRAMLKVKHERDCDCVVAGFRWYKDATGEAVGSLLLGLFDAEGALQHVGVCASFTAAKRRELLELLGPYREGALAGHPWAGWAGGEEADGQRKPGARSRWNRDKDLSWEPLGPVLVAEVAYEHMQGNRFRHMAQFRRWRGDKKPEQCTYAQLEVVAAHELQAIFRAGAGGR